MRYFVYFSYRGTVYHGWQRQPNGVSVQEVMEGALSTLLQEKITVTGAGRTDAGVHAERMVAHFDTERQLDCGSLVVRANGFLPKDIAIEKIVPVTEDAHARFSATERRYEYRIVQKKSPFLEGIATYIHYELDFDKMNEAARLLLTTKDFASFCKLHTDVKTTLCDVRDAHWEQRGEMWVFCISADRFLRNMVRAIVGTLMEVGRGRMAVEEFGKVIDRQHRTAAGMSAPAEGLFLTGVEYPSSVFILTKE